MTNEIYKSEIGRGTPEYLKTADLETLRKELEKFDLAILPNITKQKQGTCLACGNPCNPDYTFHEYCLYSIEYIRSMIKDFIKDEHKKIGRRIK